MASGEGEFLSDIECGGTTTEEEGSREPVPASNRGKKGLARVRSGVLNYNCSVSDESDADSSDGFPKSIDVNARTVELLIERSPGSEDVRDLVPHLDKRNPSDQRKKPSSKKASKPPRPPKGPVLSAADLKLVKELSELATRKRARIERMKALRKMKEAKKTSSSSNLTAMVITILFFLILICQGVFSRTNVSRKIQGSPAPAVASEGLASAQLFNNAPTNELSGPVSTPHSSWERTFSSSPREQDGRDTG